MQSNSTVIILDLIFIVILYLFYKRLRLKTLKTYPSEKLGQIRVVEKYNKERLLMIHTYAQGVSTSDKSIEKSYWYKIAQKTVYNIPENGAVLMLGLGANTISSLILKLNPNIKLTVVEFDEMIVEACHDFFELDKTPMNLILEDAYKLLHKKKAFNKKFDAILVDIFTGKPPYVSLQSNTHNFIEKLFPYLKKTGVIIFNRPGNTEEGRLDSEKLRQYLETKFDSTELFDIQDPRGYRNNVITALLKK